MPMNEIMKELENREKFLNWLYEKKIFNFNEVCKYISLYYKNKEKMLKMIEEEKKELESKVANVNNEESKKEERQN